MILFVVLLVRENSHTQNKNFIPNLISRSFDRNPNKKGNRKGIQKTIVGPCYR